MQRSEHINELAAALAAAQGEIRGAEKDTANTYYSSDYADLASCWRAIRGPLSKNGLGVVQGSSVDAGVCNVETLLTHSSGQWISSTLSAVPMRQVKGGAWEKTDNPQAIGSCITYLRRYSLMGIVGLAPTDDDGNAATGIEEEPVKRPRKRKEEPEAEPPKQSERELASQAIARAATCGAVDGVMAKAETRLQGEDLESVRTIAVQRRVDLLIAGCRTADAAALAKITPYTSKFPLTEVQRELLSNALLARDAELRAGGEK